MESNHEIQLKSAPSLKRSYTCWAKSSWHYTNSANDLIMVHNPKKLLYQAARQLLHFQFSSMQVEISELCGRWCKSFKNDPRDVATYRHIRLTDTILSIWTAAMNQAVLDINELIPDYQYNFRHNHFMIDKNHKTVDTIRKSLEIWPYFSGNSHMIKCSIFTVI